MLATHSILELEFAAIRTSPDPCDWTLIRDSFFWFCFFELFKLRTALVATNCMKGTRRRAPRTEEHLGDYHEFRAAAGEAAVLQGEAKAHTIFKRKRGFISYWKCKALNPFFHPNKHGGRHTFKFSEETKLLIHAILWNHAKAHPLSRLGEYKRRCSEEGYGISLSEICKIFKSWRWSFKKPHRKQFNKYKLDNLLYYREFKYYINFIPWAKLKFCDESHFKSKDLCRNQAISPIGETLDIPSSDMNDETFTMTLLTTLDPQSALPFEFDLRVGSNTQWDFLNFVIYLLDNEKLVAGDFFIVDNASVHHGHDAFPLLCNLLVAAGVHLIFLPKYSPELNPCEEVFSLVKGHLRCYRGSDRFWHEILKSLLKVSYEHVYKFYKHAIEFA